MKKKLSNIVLMCSCVLFVCVVFGAAIKILRNVNESEQTLSTYTAQTETTTKRTSMQTEAVTDVLEPAAIATLIPAITTAPPQPEPPVTTAPESPAPEKLSDTDIYGADKEKITIYMLSYISEIPNMTDIYFEMFPERAANVEFNVTTISTVDGLYEPALDQMLMTGSIDIFALETAFVNKYVTGDMSDYLVPYEDLGIDAEKLVVSAEIAPYSVGMGRNPDGEIVALGYQSTAGAFIYRRSLAYDTWGSDDPDFVAEKIKDWDSYLDSAAELKAKGYYIGSSLTDIWRPYSFGAKNGWVVDGEFNFDPARASFLDFAKTLVDEDYITNDGQWSAGWYAGMRGSEPVLGYFGPAWMVGYTILPSCGGVRSGEGTFGDWAVCAPTEEFFWGGASLAANKAAISEASPAKKQAIADFLTWITLDTSENGLQYIWTQGGTDETYEKDAAMSAVVMKNADGTEDILNGQDMFDIYAEVDGANSSLYNSDYDNSIEMFWMDMVREYISGYWSHDEALEVFRDNILSNFDIS